MNLEMSLLTETLPIPEKKLQYLTHHCLLYTKYKPKKFLTNISCRKTRLNGFSK